MKDVNYEILYLLDDKSLGNMCQTNKKAKALCDDDVFWRNRIERLYGNNLLKYKKEGQTWKDFYITSEEIKRVKLCRKLRDLPHSSQLVIDDFYNPITGYINVRSTLDQPGITYVILKVTLNKMLDNSLSAGKDNEEIRKLQNLLDNLKVELQEQNRTFSLDTDKFTDVDYNTFIDIINLPYITKRHLLDNMNPWVKKSLGSLDEIVTHHLPTIMYIHKLFYEKVLPADITWDELCKKIF